MTYFLVIPSFRKDITASKVPKYGDISGLYFSVFGLNSEIYSVNLGIQSEYRKIRTGKSSVFGHFSRSVFIRIFMRRF